MSVRTVLCALAVLLAAVIFGCGDDQAPASDQPAESGKLTQILRAAKTGGIAAVNERLAVRPSGKAAAAYGYPGEADLVRFQLRPRPLRRLARAVANADLGSFGSSGPTGCSDCFVYSISYGRAHVVRDQSEEIPPRLSRLLTRLTAILEAHRPAG